MANNRLFLMHVPTGKALMLGKRMALGWYQQPTVEDFEKFYNETLDDGGVENQDNFKLMIEDNEYCDISSDYVYGVTDPSEKLACLITDKAKEVK